MKDLHFEGLDLYKGDKLQGYIKKMKTQKIHKINIFIDEIDLHHYEKTLQATKQAILDDYEAEC